LTILNPSKSVPSTNSKTPKTPLSPPWQNLPSNVTLASTPNNGNLRPPYLMQRVFLTSTSPLVVKPAPLALVLAPTAGSSLWAIGARPLLKLLGVAWLMLGSPPYASAPCQVISLNGITLSPPYQIGTTKSGLCPKLRSHSPSMPRPSRCPTPPTSVAGGITPTPNAYCALSQLPPLSMLLTAAAWPCDKDAIYGDITTF
jgi:hypothetical protein